MQICKAYFTKIPQKQTKSTLIRPAMPDRTQTAALTEHRPLR